MFDRQHPLVLLVKYVIVFFIVGTAQVQAQSGDGQFYLLAKYAAKGATSVTGQDQHAVYLRWDVLEGALPDDIVQFRLMRDDLTDPLLEFAAGSLQSAAAVTQQIYGPAHQHQRLLSQVTRLKEASLSSDSHLPEGDRGANRYFQSQLFADEILTRLQAGRDGNAGQRYWAMMASRLDFNVARAANRGYLDETATGVRRYRLLAVNASNQTRQLGEVTVNATASALGNAQVLAAQHFSQVLTGRCNRIDQRSDHSVVALSWQPGGSNTTERLSNDLALSGYDLYRTIDNINSSSSIAPPIDIAARARRARHNARGELSLLGLEKVNATLITNKGQAGEANAVQFLETRADIERGGLKPGDRRYYYLVAKDFSGQYGPTVGIVVQVPDRSAPKTPWGFASLIDTQPQGARLFWDQENVENYIAHYNDGRIICNVDQALADQQVRYVHAGQSCDLHTVKVDHLDVTDYRLYRFNSFDEASRFSDYDGDGVADVLESEADRCDASVTDNAAENHLVAAGNALNTLDQQIFFTDTNVSVSKDYWYRLASVSGAGVLSSLTAPLRVSVVDREPPEAPVVEVRRQCKDKNPSERCQQPVTDGEIGEGFDVSITVNAGECAEMYLEVDGQLSRVASSCGSDDPGHLDYGHDSGQLCGIVVAIDGNNNVSPATQLPCSLVVSSQPPPAPQLRRFNVVDTNADVEWRLPLQPVASVLVEFSHNGNPLALQSVAAAGQQPGATQQLQRLVEALEGSTDEWCVRLKSVGITPPETAPLSSDWTPMRCQTRRAIAAANEDNLPWPVQREIPVQGASLQAHTGDEYADQERGVFEQFFLFVDIMPVGDIPGRCTVSDGRLLPDDPRLPFFARVTCPADPQEPLREQGDLAFQKRLKQWLPAIVYRQAITDTGEQGPWVQVTPLLDTLHWANNKRTNFLADPYFGVYRDDRNAGEWRIAFIDRYPHISGYSYHYQFVRFDERMRIEQVNASTQVVAGAGQGE